MADIDLATRELFLRTYVNAVSMRVPVVEELTKRHQVTHTGGTSIKKLVVKANMDDLVQEYSPNDALQDSKKDMLAKPEFTWKYAQLPMRYGIEEYTQNIHGGKEEQLLNLAQFLVDQAQTGFRLKLCSWVFNGGSTTGVADNAEAFQSLVSALDHNVTYGTITRTLGSSGTNDFWQGADSAGLIENISSSSQTTAYNISIANLRKWIAETDVSHYMADPSDLYIVMCPTLFNKIKAEAEAKLQYGKPAGDTVRQGFDKFYLDGHQIVSAPYLQKTSTTKTWLFILNLKYFELRLHTLRNFEQTPFEWQGKISNGHDYWLARIMVCGNFVCWKPNSSMWLSNVS